MTRVTIYTNQGEVRTIIGLNNGAKGVMNLGKDDHIILPFESDAPISFAVGDWCDLSTLDEGLALNFRKRYVITETPFPAVNVTTGGYRYELKMEAYYRTWKNYLFKYFVTNVTTGDRISAQETSWTLTADINVHLAVLLRNLRNLGIRYNGEEYITAVDNTVTTEARNINYNETSLLDALSTIANTFECEWWVTDKAICFGRCEDAAPLPLFTLVSRRRTDICIYQGGQDVDARWIRIGDVDSNKAKWRFEPQDDGSFFIVNARTGQYLSNRFGEMLNAGTPFVVLDGTTYEQVTEINKDIASVVIRLRDNADGSPVYISPQNWNGDYNEGAVTGYSKTGALSHWALVCETQLLTLTQDEEVTSIERSESEGAFATRLYVFGGTKNLPTNYRKTNATDTVNGIANSRLMLPSGTDYIDAYRYDNQGHKVYIGEEGYDTATEMRVSEAVEGVIVNDNIYPSFKATISETNYWDVEVADENDHSTGDTQRFWAFKTNTFEFNSTLLLPENVAKLGIIFTSGNCNGMSFALTFHSDGLSKSGLNGGTMDGQVFEINANEDYGRHLPDETLCPSVGDEFILTGWDSTAIDDTASPMYGKVSEAEQKLLEYGKEYVQRSMIDDGVYKAKLASHWVAADAEARTYELGQQVRLASPLFFDNYRVSRVIGYELCLDIPYDAPIYSIGESVQYSLIGELGKQVDEITYNGVSYFSTGGSGGSTIYLIKTNDTTASSNHNTYSAKRIDSDFFRKENIVGLASAVAERDNNVYSALRVVTQYLNKVTDYNIEEPQNVVGAVRFLNGILTNGTFTSGLLGSGGFFGTDLDGNSYLEVDKMLVRMTATFFELIIQKINHVGGEIVLSPASGVIEKVDIINGDGNIVEANSPEAEYYKCKLKTSDGETTINNPFTAFDLVRCQTFDNNKAKYYWRMVNYIDSECIYFKVSNDTDYTASGSDIPEAGDTIVQLGNASETDRQSAIVLSTRGIDAPSLKFYSGIDDFNLEGKCNTWFSRAGNKITGQLVSVASGKTIEEYVDENNTAITTGLNNSINSSINNVTSNLNARLLAQDNNISTIRTNTISSLMQQDEKITEHDGLLTTHGNKINNNTSNILAITQAVNENNSATVARLTEVDSELSNLGDAIVAISSKTNWVQAKDDNGNLLYYTDDTKTEATTTATDYPVYTLSDIQKNGLVTTADYASLFTTHVSSQNIAKTSDVAEVRDYVNGQNFVTSNSYPTLFNQQVANKNIARIADITPRIETYVQTNGVVTTATYASLFSEQVSSQGVAKTAEIQTYIDGEIAGISLTADKISLEGLITANGNVKINTDGTLEAKNGVFGGSLRTVFVDIEDSDAQLETEEPNYEFWRIGEQVNLCVNNAKSTKERIIILPNGLEHVGKRIMLWNEGMPTSLAANFPQGQPAGLYKHSNVITSGGVCFSGNADVWGKTEIRWINGIVELVGVKTFDYKYDPITGEIIGWRGAMLSWAVLNVNAYESSFNY